MLDLTFVLILFAWALLVGRSLARRLAPLPAHPIDQFALAAPLGLGLLALGVLGLGQVGWLDRGGIAGLMAGILTLTWGLDRLAAPGTDPHPGCADPPPEGEGENITLPPHHSFPRSAWERPLRRSASSATDHPVGEVGRRGSVDGVVPTRSVGTSDPTLPPRVRVAAQRPGEGPRPIPLAFDLALALLLLSTLLASLVPPTDGDALCYHLQVPKLFLEASSATFEPDLHETAYPLGVELLDAVALAFRGPVACRLIAWGLGLVLAAATAALARPWLGERSRWAAAIVLGVPAISNGMPAPLNDVALAAYGVAALYAWTRWLGRPTAGAAALAGLLAGLAAGVKYPALVWIAVLTAATVAATIARRGRLAHAALFLAVAALAGGAWYGRTYIHTGNPVYPFFRQIFGGAGLDVVLEPAKRPMDPTPWSLLGALGPLTIAPERFDSLAHQLGPVFLMVLPALLFARPPRRLAVIVALGYAFVIACMTQRQSTRFLLIAVGPWAAGVAWMVARWADRPGSASRLLAAGLAMLVVAEAALPVARLRNTWRVATGVESAESYLSRREPTYRVGRWIEAHLPQSARLIGQEHRGFYLPRPYAMELAHRRRTGLGRHGEPPEAIVATLRNRGFTHLLLATPVPADAVEFDPTLSDRLAPWLADRSPLYREPIVDPDGVTRLYAIYDLEAAPTVVSRPEPRR